MNRRIVVLALVVVLLVPTTVAATISGSPEIDLTLGDNRVSPGETTTLGVTILNTGEVDIGENNPTLERQVTTARGLTMSMASGSAPLDVRTAEVAVGSVPEGTAGPVSFEVVVDEDAEPGVYEVPVEVSYTYTNRITTTRTSEGGRISDYSTRDVTEEFDLSVRVTDEARFEVVSAATDAPIGGTGSVQVTVENTGTAPASDASFSLTSANVDLTFGGASTAESYVGEWAPGERRSFSFAARVGDDAERRPLALSGTVSFEDTDGTPTTESLSTGVTPAPEQTFTATTAGSTAAPGDSGLVELTLHNTGDRTLTDATVLLESSNAALTFGGSPTARTVVGEWGPGERRTVTVETAFTPDAEQRSYAVDATVSYTAPDGREATAEAVTVGVTPAAEQEFSLSSTDATLRVGDEGTLSGTVVNDGPGDVENAVLVLQPTSASIDAVESEYAVGDLAAGDAVEFQYEVDVSSEARDGPRQFSYRVEYEGSDGTTKRSDPLFARHEVGPQRDVFAVSSDASLEAGSSTTLELEVTNSGEQELTDVSAKLFADSPISVGDDEAFVDAIGPGETETIRFQISAAGSATAKVYPVSLDFQYDEPDGDTKLSDTYQVPVNVTASGGGGLFGFLGTGTGAGVGVGVGVLALGLLGVGVVYRSRTRSR